MSLGTVLAVASAISAGLIIRSRATPVMPARLSRKTYGFRILITVPLLSPSGSELAVGS